MVKKKIITLIDTNVLVRFLVRDDEKLYTKSVDIFKKGQTGMFTLILKPLVIAEACFVLESLYKLARKDIALVLSEVVQQPWLLVDDYHAILIALKKYKQGYHFVDGYLLGLVETEKCDLVTFDTKLRRAIVRLG